MTALLADIVAARADEPAVIDERGTTTWAELDERVTRLVHALQDRGLRSGDTVVAMLGNQVELIEATLACAHGGWLLVPLNWHWVPRRGRLRARRRRGRRGDRRRAVGGGHDPGAGRCRGAVA